VKRVRLDVLLEFKEDWSKIKQIVLEVHDLNRVKGNYITTEKIMDLAVTVEQEQYLRGT